MKYAIIIPDGCADEPQAALDGRTPLQAAHTPAMDAVAAAGVVGTANHVPASLPAGSAVANMSLLGYDPLEHFTGRAPLEAAAQGIELGPDDWAIRCNLVTVEEQIMRDFTADHISSDEAKSLLKSVTEDLSNEPWFSADQWEFVPGVSYRNLLLYRGSTNSVGPFSQETSSTPPHDLTDKSIIDDYPRGPGSDVLSQLMGESLTTFAEHPVNVARVKAGKSPATNIWLWGLGRRPNLQPFADVYHRSGAMITAVDLLRGLAAIIGWQCVEVPGATGYTDTDYVAKGRYAIETLSEVDLVCVHVEATDEASHEGDVAAKIKAIEEIDRHIVTPVYEHLRSLGPHRVLILPDHVTSLRTRTHSHGAIPFAMAGTGVEPNAAKTYDEPTAEAAANDFAQGWKLMNFFLTGE